MSLSSREEPAFELPQPQVEQQLTPPSMAEQAPVQSEKVSRQVELPGGALPPVSGADATVAGVPATPSPAVPATMPQSLTTPSVADDADLIEKEWVDKAKAIVEHTRHDPHQQNEQLNQFKADYMKKRYSKEIKLSDE